MDEQVRAGLKGQTPVVVEFPIGKEGITLDFAEQVEKGLELVLEDIDLFSTNSGSE